MKRPKRSQYKHTKKPYRVRNWRSYEAGLRSRGDLTVWISEDAIKCWRAPASGKPGGRNIRSIRKLGRRHWPKRSGYSRRSMVETTIYRYQRTFGREMRSRTLAGQRVETRIACEILNTMAQLGMPDSYRVA